MTIFRENNWLVKRPHLRTCMELVIEVPANKEQRSTFYLKTVHQIGFNF